jgi:hypothetical protein
MISSDLFRFTARTVTHYKESSMKKPHRWFVFVLALVGLAMMTPGALAQYTPGGPTYKDFAAANGWYSVDADGRETWVANRQPDDDPDNDGLTNEEEWLGPGRPYR